MFSAPRLILIILACLLGLNLSAAPYLDIKAAAIAPKIDGVIAPGEWDAAARTDAFRQVYPGENVAPTEQTEAWVTYDGDNLYVAIRCHDSAGLAGIRAYSMLRDQNRMNPSDDMVRVVIDTFDRQSDGYYFGLTAAGGKDDGLVQNKDQGDDQWDALWIGKVSRDEGGWSAEFAIPAKSIAFDPSISNWGFEIARTIRRKQENIRWANYIRAKSPQSLPDLGQLRGFTGLRQGRGLEFKPFASLTSRSNPRSDEKKLDFKPGLDFVWHVTPSLAATITMNTDFADAEVDERKVNLGRFPLFFPEKRSFFTQDASLFTFASINQDPLPFFSRRIGLGDDGTKVGLLGGAKLTGRAGPWTIGLLDVQIDSHENVSAKNLLVARVSHQVLDESSLGFIATNGDPRANGDNRLFGTDFNYTNSHFAGDKSLSVNAGVQVTDSDLAGGMGTATTLTVNFPNEPLNLMAMLSSIDGKFDPALGFVSRTGVNNMHLVGLYNIYPKSGPIRLYQPFLETLHTSTLDLDMLDGHVFYGLYGETHQGDFFNFYLGSNYETFDTPFAIRPNVIIPQGRLPYNDYLIEVGSARARPVNLYAQWWSGEYLTGHADRYRLNLGWRPSSRFEFSLATGLRKFRLPEGDFNVRLGSARFSVTFSPDLQVSLIGQYDNISKSLGTNFRIKWIMKPGNEFYFVVNQGYDTSEKGYRPTAGDVSVKGTWTYRF